MTRVEQAGIKSCSCPNCFGNWMTSIALTRTVRLAAEQPEDGVSIPDLAETVNASDTKKKLRCPQCEKEMLKDKFHPMIPVGIDRCRGCNMIWLDAGELALLRALYRELITSDDPEIVRRREKVATILMQWEGRERAVDEAARQVDTITSADDFNLLSYLLP
jgi:Zn-finger nucleic acid-binding protein